MTSTSDSNITPTVADCGRVSELALSVYKSCRSSAEDFQNMADDMSNLYMALRDIRDDLTQDPTGLSHTGVDSLQEKLNSAFGALRCLDAELQRYEKLPIRAQKKYAFLKDVLTNTGEAHTIIVSATTGLRYLEKKLSLNSEGALEKIIMKYLREVRDGLHESSVLNLVPEDEVIDKKMNWEKFRRELGELNITPAVLEEHKAFIQAIMRRAKQMGDLDTEIPSEPDSETRAMSEDLDRRYEQRAVDMEQLRNKSQHVDSKKSTPLVALGLRALRIVSDERLIEAADEGKLDRVVSLLRRRVNVNASDKWRWTALHMAAYGGYNDIAQVLIAAGADLNARTVDGETPLKLAERNRHIDVVCTISDEVERRREDLERQTAQNTTATTGDGEK